MKSLAFLAIVVIGLFRAVKTQRSPQQPEFLSGSVPTPLPDGFFSGSVSVRTSWQGKTFDSSTNRGINIFKAGDRLVEKYPFKTYHAPGLADPKLPVLRIDYNLPENPVWLRLIVDEIVQTAPNHYLGKVHIRLPLRKSLPLGFFQLKKK